MHLSVERYLPDFNLLDDPILYIETSEEMPTSGFVYRFISALGELDRLHKFKAILVAYPKAQFCDRQPPGGREAYIAEQQEAIKNALKDYNAKIPIVFNMNFGHTDPQMIIPNGSLVSIDSTAKTIYFN